MKLYTCVYESCEVRTGPKSTLKFANFVKPKTDLVRTIGWVFLTGRTDKFVYKIVIFARASQ